MLFYLYYGAGLLGSGGGGSAVMGMQILEQILPKIDNIFMVSPNDVPDDAICAVPCLIGAASVLNNPKIDKSILVINAYTCFINELKKQGKIVTHIMQGETGNVNSLVPLIIAANFKIPIVDVCGIGRGVPSITLTTYYYPAVGSFVPANPVVLANNEPGHEVIFESADAAEIEKLMRPVVGQPQFNNGAGCCLWPQDGATMKRATIPYCVSQAMELGYIINTYKGTPNAIPDIISYINRIRPIKYVGEGKVTVSNIVANGLEQILVKVKSDTKTLTLCGLNENAITYSSDQIGPLYVDPDIVSYLKDDGTVLCNSDLVNDSHVHVVALPCLYVVRRNTKLMEAFGQLNSQLGYYGMTFTHFPPYIPKIYKFKDPK